MTVSSDSHPPFAHELLIAQLAVQRAALVTKRVLATINAARSQPLPTNTPSHQPAPDSEPDFDFDTCASPSIYTTPVSETPTTGFPFTPSPSQSQSQSQSQPIGQFLHPSSSPTSPARGSQPPAHPGLPRRLSLAKPDTSPVTIADLAAQALLVAAVHTAFPGDLIIGEEDASALRADGDLAAQVWELVATTRLEDAGSEALLGRPRGVEEMMALLELGVTTQSGGGGAQGGVVGGRRVWCLDPIDGTSAYMQGGQYAISLALLEGGREVVGVLGCPNWRFEAGVPVGKWKVREHGVDEEGMGLLLSAVRGQGASVRPMGRGVLREARRIDRGRGKAVDLRDLHFVDSEKSPATLTEKVKEMAGIVGAEYRGTNLYSSHMRYAAMVLGGREFVQLRWPKPGKSAWSCWDHAGSQLIYTESGAGKVTDLSGNPVDFSTGNKLSRSWGVITADESIHGKILALTNRMRAAEA
ncbi:uncharacterized protein B0H64DRAFT_345356 [Chaetomium fimeti]|uniref:3'(2'),5'-bisphosphate nucleotidase n=1 Tax=Chaetomium fimeti TaxID=1854472 RepID=A0AAE0LQF4_9PEZI|nr:hypothetical protein B0H64DRAFT_345356 [Chaetomium fimeti]